MIENLYINSFMSKKLLEWYENNKRKFPWRDTDIPYEIWLSEIILQQTKVTQGLPYYNKFISQYPKLKDLVFSSENEVLKLWQGLGYYSRARNMHFTAKFIYNELNGVFPDNYKDLLKLKGIGDYTASAIASFAFGEVVPVLDGNVYRFISRYIGIETPINSSKAKKEFKEILHELIDKNNPADFNQAIMEFGSLQCTPKKPDCEKCIFIDSCFAYNSRVINSLPVKIKSKKSKTRYFTYYYLNNSTYLYLKKRVGDGIWKNLFEFPLSENEDIYNKEQIDSNLFEISTIEQLIVVKVHEPIKHILSHQNIFAKLIEINIEEKFEMENFMKVEKDSLDSYPVHRLMEKMIEKIQE